MESSGEQDAHLLVAHLFRHQAGRIVAALTRLFGSRYLDLAEDVVQDALVKALQQWPFKGIPENPAGWLTLVAKNRALDLLRRDSSLELKVAELERSLTQSSPVADNSSEGEMDDQLALILMCSHPALAIEGQVALTLRSACGFSTAEIARAFLTPEATIAQRLVRAKRQIREQGIVIDPPNTKLIPERLDGVLRVIYLLFNEGYGATRGNELVRADLCGEAIRLCTLLLHHGLRVPAVHALLALMLLQAARLPARTQDDGTLAILAKQDRSMWDQRLIAGGLRHLAWSAAGDTLTVYHLQAEIAAFHATAKSDADTEWAGIAALYDQLHQLEPTPIVALNRAIAKSRSEGPRAGIRALEEIDSHPALRHYHLLSAVRAELWKQIGDFQRAADAYRAALACPCTEPERRFLESQLQLIDTDDSSLGIDSSRLDL
ncbi:MAG TPA: sigma-70 family RNA polymerase sigma factor [Pyrinomonadaceae bacterium]|nr:sigma-70 family RNA polymerase sigma factor [Pyrinomonadaceae bacterium]